MSNIKNIVENIMTENLVDAKSLIQKELLSRLGTVLEEQIEQIAPSMISEEDDNDSDDSRKKSKTYYLANKEKSKSKKKTNIKDNYDPAVDQDEFDSDFEDFVDQIHEIVQEIEQETGEQLSEEEIVQLGNEYLALLSEESDSDDELVEELVGNQHKLDKNNNKKLDREDFKLLGNKSRSNKSKGK